MPAHPALRDCCFGQAGCPAGAVPPLSSTTRYGDLRFVSNDSRTVTSRLHEALAILDEVVADRALLAAVDASMRERLQRLCGEVARPNLKQRKALQKELLRRERRGKKEHDESLRQSTQIRQLRSQPVFAPSWPPAAITAGTDEETPRTDADEGRRRSGPRLFEPRVCYVCKSRYFHLHFFYDQLCPACGDVNFEKRTPQHDLRGRVALVTGARVKIGYHAALMLLRNGCDVLVTTRFPRDAAARYAREPDFAAWGERLQIWGLDLRHTPSVDALARHLCTTLPRLDFVIHNACQTVRRPPGFYGHLMEQEQAPLSSLSPAVRRVLSAAEDFRTSAQGAPGVLSSAALSQITTEADRYTLPASTSTAALESLFPRGALDADLQQVDLRTHNSWRTTLGEVPAVELLEVLLVNAAAPFLLSSKVLPLMRRDNAGRDRHIVNVSAMEGQFYRAHKTDKHPHTNMAKAALNMLTRTSSMELAPEGIWMNAVDTGWVTDEDPAHLAELKVAEHRFSPPLDVVDGAARIVDPVFDGLRSGNHASGVFLKDYKPTPW
jgi:NAD(P)-dependent dehydrogenase (short-subunit alcohol dehydrogenase family)